MVEVDWEPSGWRDVFLNSPEVASALMEHGEQMAASNSAGVLAVMHSPVVNQPYVCDLRKLRNTQAAVIHSTSKAVAAAGRAHGFPHL